MILKTYKHFIIIHLSPYAVGDNVKIKPEVLAGKLIVSAGDERFFKNGELKKRYASQVEFVDWKNQGRRI